MKILCKECSALFRIDDSKIPPCGKKVSCPKCKNVSFAERLQTGPPLTAAVPGDALMSVILENQETLRKVIEGNLQWQGKALEAIKNLPREVSPASSAWNPEESVLKPVSPPSSSSAPDSISSVETVFLDFDEYLNS